MQDGVPGSYMLAVFKRVAHELSEICYKFVSREAYCSCKVSRVCCINRDMGAENGRHDRIVYDQRTPTERCEHEFQALQSLSLLSHGSRG